MIQLKRAYEPVESTDGRRILVERLWPRGVSKTTLALDEWMKEIAPSAGLRTWFHDNREQWAEFRRRYRAELEKNGALCEALRAIARKDTVTLIYAAHDVEHNSAVLLKEFLEHKPARRE
jgi:uncharacterized protein YeaO (DUF488 family)